MNIRTRLAALFLLLSLLFAWYAVLLQGLYWLLVWPALSFLGVGLAYARVGPSMFAKRAEGKLPLQVRLLFGPYLLLSWLGWLGLKVAQGKAPWDQVAPGLFVGRRLDERELPPDISIIVDVTCEFSTRHPALPNRRYLCLPTLDATAPERQALMALIRVLREERGAIFIHCAAGHGRSATVAAGLLLVRGIASTPAEAEALLKQGRPKVKLNPEQMAALEDLAHQL